MISTYPAAIMDLLLVPKTKVMRQIFLNIFTSTMAPNPIELLNERTQRHSGMHKKKSREHKESKVAFVDKCLASAIENEGLPTAVAERFHTFVSHGNSLPYSTDVRKALDTILNASKRLYQTDINSGKNKDTRSLQRAFEGILKSIYQIKSFLETIESFGINLVATQSKTSGIKGNGQMSHPAYISLDLGLRPGNSYYHDIVYQAILVQDNFYEEDKSRSYRGFSSKGVRIAEGGR
jgi:hypothetical protein